MDDFDFQLGTRWLDAERDASVRARRVILLLHMFGLLCLLVWANMRRGDWFTQRVTLARDARVLLTCVQHGPPAQVPDAMPKTLSDAMRIDLLGDGSRVVQIRPGIPDDQHPALATTWVSYCVPEAKQGSKQRESLVRAARWLLFEQASSADMPDVIARTVENQRDAVYKVPVPFVGMIVDPNDFGWLAGTAHLTLLIWLCLALSKSDKVHMLREFYLPRLTRKETGEPYRKLFERLQDAQSFFAPDDDAPPLSRLFHRFALLVSLWVAFVPLSLIAYQDVAAWGNGNEVVFTGFRARAERAWYASDVFDFRVFVHERAAEAADAGESSARRDVGASEPDEAEGSRHVRSNRGYPRG